MICGVLSLLGGWYHLAAQFKSDALVEGELFRLRSGSMGWEAFPISYRSTLFATVGAQGFALSVLFPFRFLHPQLVIPWSAVERCEYVKVWFADRVAVHIAGCSRRLLFSGDLGATILEAWTHSRRATSIV